MNKVWASFCCNKDFCFSTIKHEQDLDDIGVIILCGGEGKRLSPLTQNRCKPTVSFGGRYKLIDIPISHAITSGLSKIFVIGQYLAFTLQQHLFKTYFYHGVVQDQIQLLVPEERLGTQVWYKGTADAIRQNLTYLKHVKADYFLILSGDQLYNINFRSMISSAKKLDAGLLIASQPISKSDASRMGVLKIDCNNNGKLIDFYEKPKDPMIMDSFSLDEDTAKAIGLENREEKPFLGSMGIYLFKREVLFDLLQEDNRHDFGKHLIASQIKKNDVYTFIYDGYWADIGTVESYYYANLELTKNTLCPSDQNGMIFSKHNNLPGAMVSDSIINNALLCEGSFLTSSSISNSIIGVRSVVQENSVISDSIVLGNDGYNEGGIGPNSIIKKTIIDENVYIGKGVRLVNDQGLKEYDSPDGLFVIRDGIIVIPGRTRIPDHYTF